MTFQRSQIANSLFDLGLTINRANQLSALASEVLAEQERIDAQTAETLRAIDGARSAIRAILESAGCEVREATIPDLSEARAEGQDS